MRKHMGIAQSSQGRIGGTTIRLALRAASPLKLFDVDVGHGPLEDCLYRRKLVRASIHWEEFLVGAAVALPRGTVLLTRCHRLGPEQQLVCLELQRVLQQVGLF